MFDTGDASSATTSWPDQECAPDPTDLILDPGWDDVPPPAELWPPEWTADEDPEHPVCACVQSYCN